MQSKDNNCKTVMEYFIYYMDYITIYIKYKTFLLHLFLNYYFSLKWLKLKADFWVNGQSFYRLL